LRVKILPFSPEQNYSRTEVQEAKLQQKRRKTSQTTKPIYGFKTKKELQHKQYQAAKAPNFKEFNQMDF
jgi:hypothetical protein